MSSTRLSRRAALAVGLSIVAIMVVWAPMLALANNSQAATAQAGGNSASAPGQTGEAGNSASAPGQQPASVTETTTATTPGNSGSAPGQTKTEPSPTDTSTAPTSNAGGNSNAGTNPNAGGGNPNAGGGNPNAGTTNGGAATNPNAGGGNPNAGGGNPNAGGGNASPGGGNPNAGGGNSSPGGGNPNVGGGQTCDGDPSGKSGTGSGANSGGSSEFDNSCPSGNDSAPNGNGNGGAKGKPCAGCVGNADDKNPPGQSKGDHNNGYECEPDRNDRKGNKGVGKGNPAHTGCKPTPPPPPSTTTYDCVGGDGHELPNDHNHTATGDGLCHTPTTTYDCVGGDGHELPNNHNHGKTGDGLCEQPDKTFDCLGHDTALGHKHTAAECNPKSPPPPPLVDCDNDGVDDNVDSDISSCEPPPAGEDCDEDGVPDDVDTDLSDCEPTERPDTCPDGTPMPADGACVKGIIINRPPDVDKDEDTAFPPLVAGEQLAAPENVAPSVLPFTGGNLLPFLMVSLGLVATGTAAAKKRRKSA